MEEGMSPVQITAQPFDYRGLVGPLMYLVRGTRPDIANAVRELCKFLSCYNKTHCKVAQTVLKYLKGTSTYGLIFGGRYKEVQYEPYTDATFANANEIRKSVTDACNTWKSSRQDTVSLYTAQTELIAGSEGVKECEWLWYLLEELGFKRKRPIVCRCDNKGAISIIKDPVNHTSTKHINGFFRITHRILMHYKTIETTHGIQIGYGALQVSLHRCLGVPNGELIHVLK
ncbi:unnamed protein product [Phytophthora fragariaefolia]|uniref:Unnamed protein product n=1 Tax=Phytophthora fragariaefolia TaxID=1490495 RepID=A0A9W6TTV4_9STRA|nr:unnamed protein product [Phytophthora fragariaefolia]